MFYNKKTKFMNMWWDLYDLNSFLEEHSNLKILLLKF